MKTWRTGWLPFPHFGFAAYRIWVRLQDGLWQQCHEWRRADGSTHRERWIKSIAHDAAWLAEAEEVPAEEAIS